MHMNKKKYPKRGWFDPRVCECGHYESFHIYPPKVCKMCMCPEFKELI